MSIESIIREETIHFSINNNRLIVACSRSSGSIKHPISQTRLYQIPTQSSFYATVMKILAAIIPCFNTQWVPLSLEIEQHVYYVSRFELAERFAPCYFPNNFHYSSNEEDGVNNANNLKRILLTTDLFK